MIRINQYLLVFGMFILLILIGCSNPTVIYKNRTIYNDSCIPIIINNTQYINITTVIPCNITEPEINTIIYDRDYVLSLIRQLKRYEKQQDKFINHSDCFDELNTTTIELDRCTNELCYENSSWCN